MPSAEVTIDKESNKAIQIYPKNLIGLGLGLGFGLGLGLGLGFGLGLGLVTGKQLGCQDINRRKRRGSRRHLAVSEQHRQKCPEYGEIG